VPRGVSHASERIKGIYILRENDKSDATGSWGPAYTAGRQARTLAASRRFSVSSGLKKILVIFNMVAICFYTPDSYKELKVVADDKEVLCDTYSDWLIEFSKANNGLRNEGMEVVPITINIDKLVQWCKQNNLKNTSSGRSKYVAELSRLQSEDLF
jgi:hypothetical protein